MINNRKKKNFFFVFLVNEIILQIIHKDLILKNIILKIRNLIIHKHTSFDKKNSLKIQKFLNFFYKKKKIKN